MTNTNQHKTTELPNLIGNLKNEDAKYSRIAKAFQGIYFVFIPLFLLIIIYEQMDEYNLRNLIGGTCSILAFLIFAVFFRKYYKEYRDVDYDLPTLQMLRQAVLRYQPFRKNIVWIFTAIALINSSQVLSQLESSSTFREVMIFEIIFIAIVAASIGTGLLVWYFKYKPLQDAARELIKEIEGTE